MGGSHVSVRERILYQGGACQGEAPVKPVEIICQLIDLVRSEKCLKGRTIHMVPQYPDAMKLRRWLRGPSDQFPLRGKGGAEGTKGGAFPRAKRGFMVF